MEKSLRVVIQICDHENDYYEISMYII